MRVKSLGNSDKLKRVDSKRVASIVLHPFRRWLVNDAKFTVKMSRNPWCMCSSNARHSYACTIIYCLSSRVRLVRLRTIQPKNDRTSTPSFCWHDTLSSFYSLAVFEQRSWSLLRVLLILVLLRWRTNADRTRGKAINNVWKQVSKSSQLTVHNHILAISERREVKCNQMAEP